MTFKYVTSSITHLCFTSSWCLLPSHSLPQHSRCGQRTALLQGVHGKRRRAVRRGVPPYPLCACLVPSMGHEARTAVSAWEPGNLLKMEWVRGMVTPDRPHYHFCCGASPDQRSQSHASIAFMCGGFGAHGCGFLAVQGYWERVAAHQRCHPPGFGLVLAKLHSFR